MFNYWKWSTIVFVLQAVVFGISYHLTGDTTSAVFIAAAASLVAAFASFGLGMMASATPFAVAWFAASLAGFVWGTSSTMSLLSSCPSLGFSRPASLLLLARKK